MAERGSADTPRKPAQRRDTTAPCMSPHSLTIQRWHSWRETHGGAPPSQHGPNAEERRLATRFSQVPRARKVDEAVATYAKALAFHDKWGALPQQSLDPSREEERKLAKELINRRRAKTLSAEAQDLLERIKLLESSKESPHTGSQKKHKACSSTCEAARNAG